MDATPRERRSPPAENELSAWIFLAAVAAVVGLVWFVLWLGGGTSSGSQIRDEEAITSGFVTLLPNTSSWLGVELLLSQPDHQSQLEQATVARVMAGSPAFAAGLQAGDVILRADGHRLTTPAQLGNVVARHRPGDTVPVTVERYGRQRKLHVTLSQRPMGRLAAATTPAAASPAWLGVDVQPIDSLMVDRLGLPDDRGVIIAYVHPASPAVACDLRQGDVLRRAGDTRLRDIGQLDGLVASRKPGDTLRLLVWRNGVQMEIRAVLGRPPPKGQERQPVLPEAEVEIEAAWLGLDIVPMSPAEAEELGLPESLRGMVIDDVAAGPGVDAGLLAGDVITAVNGKPTPTVDAFKDATEGAAGALIDTIRAGRHIYISVPPPGAQNDGRRQPPVQQVTFWR